MATNRSYHTDGLDDPNQLWLRRLVRVPAHPEWGEARVLRWYPAQGDKSQQLRIKPAKHGAPKVVSVLEVEVVSES